MPSYSYKYQKQAETIRALTTIEDFPIYQQQHRFSCGIACVRMLLSYFGEEIDEQSIKRKTFTTYWGGGTPSYSLMRGANKFLKKHGYKMRIHHNLDYNAIKENLRKGLPMLHIYMCPRGKNPHFTKQQDGHNAHYMYLMEIDECNEEVTVLNPYGYFEKIPLDIRWDRIALKWEHISQVTMKVIRGLQLVRPRTFYTIEQIR